MSSAGAAPRAAVTVSNARAAASRKNGAKSRGPKTAEGKARAARNALKHGLRAGKHVLLPDEDSAEFEALETALFEELAPDGALQGLLAGRIARAAWRLARAERIEVEMFAERHYPGAGPGLAIIRDGNSTRSFETLLRYRGAALAEFTRCLRTLQVLQAKTAPGKRAARAASAALRVLDPSRERSGKNAPDRAAGKVRPQAQPIEPETRGDRGASGPTPAAHKPDSTPAVRPAGQWRDVQPSEPKPNEPEPFLQSRFGRMLTGQPMPAPAPGALGPASRGWDRGRSGRGAAPSR